MKDKRNKLLNYASNGHINDGVLPDMVICKDKEDYEKKVQEWEDEGEPPRVFIVPDENCKKVFRSEAEID